MPSLDKINQGLQKAAEELEKVSDGSEILEKQAELYLRLRAIGWKLNNG